MALETDNTQYAVFVKPNSPEYYWSQKDGYTLNTKLSTKKYTDLASAKAACASKAKCHGVVKVCDKQDKSVSLRRSGSFYINSWACLDSCNLFMY